MRTKPSCCYMFKDDDTDARLSFQLVVQHYSGTIITDARPSLLGSIAHVPKI